MIFKIKNSPTKPTNKYCLYFSFGTSHYLMFFVRSNWPIGGPPEFMKRKLAKGKLFN